MTFKSDVKGFAERLSIGLDQSYRDAVTSTLEQVRDDTPVVTGATREAWTTNVPIEDLRFGDEVVILNDTQAALALEFGSPSSGGNLMLTRAMDGFAF